MKSVTGVQLISRSLRDMRESVQDLDFDPKGPKGIGGVATSSPQDPVEPPPGRLTCWDIEVLEEGSGGAGKSADLASESVSLPKTAQQLPLEHTLSPEALNQVFPFHIVVDPNGRILQVYLDLDIDLH